MSDLAISELREWIGRSESCCERISATPASLLAATLDAESTDLRDGMALPPLFHWVYFLPVCRQSSIDQDGHPARGAFLPPIPLPRRMWAAGSIEFSQPLIIGEMAVRTSHIIDVTSKQGRSGLLIFVKIQHVIADAAGRIALTEVQDLVYRDKPTAGEAVPDTAGPLDAALWSREVQPDSTLLFRYSALTFNAHRIHYDRPYATQVERYPALVVHGPLVATLLVDHLLRHVPTAQLRSFAFRAERPLFDDAPFFLCAQRGEESTTFRLWSRNAAGARCTDASATIDPLIRTI